MAKVEQVLSLEPQHELKFRGKPEAGYLLPQARPCATRPGPEGPDNLAVTSVPARRRVRPAPREAEGQRRPGAGAGGGGGAALLSLQPLCTVAILTLPSSWRDSGV